MRTFSPLDSEQDPAPVRPSKKSATHSIRSRLLTLGLVITIFAVIVISAIAIDSANTVSRSAQAASSASLRSQAEAYLVQINDSVTKQNDLILDRAARDVKTLATAAAMVFSEKYPAGYWPVAAHMVKGQDGQYLNNGSDISSVFVPKTQNYSAEVIQQVEQSAYLDPMLEALFKNNPNAAAIYLGTQQDVLRYYPNVKLGEVVPSDFQVTQRVWYTASLEGNAGKQEPSPVWSPVYADATGLGLVTTVAIPVYEPGGKLIGVAGLDLTLDEISHNIAATRLLQSGYSFLVDQNGKSIILPDQGYQDFLGRSSQPKETGTDLKSEEARSHSPEFAALVDQMTQSGSGFKNLQVGGKELFVAYSPLTSTGWSLASVVPAQEVLKSVTALQQELQQTTRTLVFTRVLPITAAILVFMVALSLVWTNQLVTPIQKLAEAARKIGAGQWDVQMPVQSSDEIGLLAKTLGDMAAQLRQFFEKLEQRVAERTQQLEQHSLHLQTAAEVARDMADAQDLNELLNKAVNLINDRFGLYNVGIFLIDEAGEMAHLKAASGELGAKLVEQEIKLKVGQQGIIGYVTQVGRARIATDVEADNLYLPTPILQETRSEVALPLRVGDRIIGAMDIQSRQETKFDRDEVTVLQTLADQLASAIENMRLVARLQATLKEMDDLSLAQVRKTWLISESQPEAKAFEYDRLEVKPIDGLPAGWTAERTAGSAAPANRLVVPVKLHGQIIGRIGLESEDPTHEWSEDEIAIVEATANQAAQTLENARLLAETQQRAAREQLTGEVTARMRASLDVESVLRTAVEEIYQAIKPDNLVIQLMPALEDEK